MGLVQYNTCVHKHLMFYYRVHVGVSKLWFALRQNETIGIKGCIVNRGSLVTGTEKWFGVKGSFYALLQVWNAITYLKACLHRTF